MFFQGDSFESVPSDFRDLAVGTNQCESVEEIKPSKPSNPNAFVLAESTSLTADFELIKLIIAMEPS